MEQLQYKKHQISKGLKQVKIISSIAIVPIVLILLILGVTNVKHDTMPISMTITGLLFVVALIFLLIGNIEGKEFDNNSFSQKKEFMPSHILFHKDFYGECNLGIDANRNELCISQRNKNGIYDLTYFGLDEIISNVILQNEKRSIKIESASYSTKVAGALVGGLAGSLVAGALGGKRKEITVVKNITFRISLKTNPNTSYDVQVYSGFVGMEEDELRRCKEYNRAIEYHEMINTRH